MTHDEISNPAHYDLFPDGMQAIDVIRAALTPEEFAGYCKGNFLKYRLRAGEKGDPAKCLGKAEWYRAELREHHLATSGVEKQLEPANPEGSTLAPNWPTEEPTVLPDGGAFAVMSFPLPADHWLYAPRQYADGAVEPRELPHPILNHDEHRETVTAAVRYAVRGATNCGAEPDFDPDALVQNAVYALCGPFSKWPDEASRQDAEAEDEAFAAIEASQPKAGHDFPDAPDWDSHSWPQIVKDEDGNWWGVKAGWKMSINHGFKGDYFSILNGDGEFLKRGADPVNWRSSLQQRPYAGQGGVMIQYPGCVATSCECRP